MRKSTYGLKSIIKIKITRTRQLLTKTVKYKTKILASYDNTKLVIKTQPLNVIINTPQKADCQPKVNQKAKDINNLHEKTYTLCYAHNYQY